MNIANIIGISFMFIPLGTFLLKLWIIREPTNKTQKESTK